MRQTYIHNHAIMFIFYMRLVANKNNCCYTVRSLNLRQIIHYFDGECKVYGRPGVTSVNT